MAPVAFAAPGATVSVSNTMQLDRIVTEGTAIRHELVDATTVSPGNHLVITMICHNDGAVPATNFVLVDPVPAQVLLASDGFGTFDVSVDGGASWGKLAALTVSDGKGGRRAAQASDVSHLRWTIAAIAPGASATVSYHAVVR